jgi:hypothetical protein
MGSTHCTRAAAGARLPRLPVPAPAARPSLTSAPPRPHPHAHPPNPPLPPIIKAFDLRDRAQTGGVDAAGPAGDQGGCFACVAFALLGAARSAAALALRRDAGAISLSEQDFQFCSTADQGFERGCASSWSVRDGAHALLALQAAGRGVVTERCLPYDPAPHVAAGGGARGGSGRGAGAAAGGPRCGYKCHDVDPAVEDGRFTTVPLSGGWDVQVRR